MKALGVLFVLLLVGIVVLGFFRGWFQLSTDTANQQSSATITVNRDRIHEDEQAATDKVQGFSQQAKEKIGNRAGKAQEPDRRP